MRWLCVLLLCSLSACMTRYDDPVDVRLVSLKLEDGPYKDYELDLIKIREMIDVEVVTNLNYTAFAKEHFVTVEFHFCDQMDMDVRGLGGLDLYRYDKRWIRVDDHEEGKSNLAGPYHYHTAFSSFAHKEEPISREPTILDYDLRDSPRDICFQIVANSGYVAVDRRVSNVVRIPKEALIKLFAEYPRRAPPPN
jgi:hypothetical protein